MTEESKEARIARTRQQKVDAKKLKYEMSEKKLKKCEQDLEDITSQISALQLENGKKIECLPWPTMKVEEVSWIDSAYSYAPVIAVTTVVAAATALGGYLLARKQAPDPQTAILKAAAAAYIESEEALSNGNTPSFLKGLSELSSIAESCMNLPDDIMSSAYKAIAPYQEELIQKIPSSNNVASEFSMEDLFGVAGEEYSSQGA